MSSILASVAESAQKERLLVRGPVTADVLLATRAARHNFAGPHILEPCIADYLCACGIRCHSIGQVNSAEDAWATLTATADAPTALALVSPASEPHALAELILLPR
ncbi:hypothetical protein ACFWPK_09200 [Nocardia sp. NPDC058519]|uniref:hypothetical protein n=1 Tax=Nocardia sp. NPDC058519 TaxID=3346535 RepID=UPI003646CA2A